MAVLGDFALQGLCNEHDDPSLWFPTRGHAGKVAAQEAKSVCAACPVLSQCEEWGLAHERFGVWGGLTPVERWDIRKERKMKVEEPNEAELYG